ncbi:ABC transporter ATP-binding protein [Cytophagales bacterium LB-30]|uniref:ABC transporter ATP-binding protein n=1 Tax=Shiella aurantiaca TaxID=3058365 RepID=A0ABT8F3P9_9BACT|nr:ABC transporter ATP-binding protein [Shiella aurantiaca]MDN4165088.1 ABC transporter ATP-binding protein [Shiella aurantiaca]
MLKASNIEKSYGQLPVLKGVDIWVKKGEMVAIVGASGAGKSTLLHISGTLDKADKGEVFIDDTPVHSLSDQQLSAFRNARIGFIFQFHNLLPEFTGLENVCMPGWIAGKPKQQVEARAIELLTLLGVKDRAHHKPSELSGGEQQRMAVARALINEPAIVFADEPSGNLDSHNADELHKLFHQLKTDLGQTFVIVTHNSSLAALADRTLEMKDGQILGGL